MLLGSMINSAQAQEIYGVVRDAISGEVLRHVNVVLQTTDSVFVAGVTSDDNGKFVIPKVNAGDYRLVISYIGYETQHIEVTGLTKSLILPEILLAEEEVYLNTVTVIGSVTTSRIDYKLIFPTDRQVKASTGGIDLLQQLMIPGIQVSPLTGTVGVSGGGEAQLRVNGVRAETSDIVALLPEDIIRVEYHENPGLRYGNATAVINYIVHRHATGVSLGVNIRNAFNLTGYGENTISGRISHRKSEFAVNYHISTRKYRKMWRDNEETFRFADGSNFRRKETGEPGQRQSAQNNLNMAYSYMNDKHLFNATLRYYSYNQPNSVFNGKLADMANPDIFVWMFDQEKQWSSRPALDLYYQENLRNDQILVLNFVETYNYTDNNRVYRESSGDRLLTDIDNKVTGNKYSWIGEGIYEKKFVIGSLSAGLRHTRSRSDNAYKNGHEYRTKMRQSETFLYTQWRGKMQKLDYTLGVGATRSSLQQPDEGVNHNAITFTPRMTLFYSPEQSHSIRFNADIGNIMPTLSELSAVEQAIDSFQIQRGNPNLKSYLRYKFMLNYEWKKGIFYAGFNPLYFYQPSTVMEEKFPSGYKIVKTWDNQKTWQLLRPEGQFRVVPLKDILTISLYGGIYHIVSNGNMYRHVYSEPYVFAEANANYKNFQLYFYWQPIPWGQLYGETLEKGEIFHHLSLSYKYRDMKFGVEAYNPLFNDYRVDTKNYSVYASNKRSLYINDLVQMYLFSFSWNVNFGRSSRSGERRLNNADNDSGVMKVGK
jgi:hypothetical protein